MQAPSGKLDHFLPISDFTFSSMREALLAEYSSALSQQECLRAGTCATGRETCVQARRTIDILVTAGRHDCRCCFSFWLFPSRLPTGQQMSAARSMSGLVADPAITLMSLCRVMLPCCRSQAAIVRQLTPDTPLDLINLPDSHTQGSRRESDDVITLL